MSGRVALQMDPIEPIDINADSSFVLGLEALARGYELFHYGPQDLCLAGGTVRATARPLFLRREEGNHFSMGPAQDIDLATMDVILMRQDPPFDMSYITATHFLDMIHPKTLVVNDPTSVRNAPEKLLCTHFPELMPATTIAHDPARLTAFRAEHGDIILKPLFGNGGIGVFHITAEDENFNSAIELFHALNGREPIIAQAYVPAVREGDKRIILVEGEPIGAINRVPAEGEARANMHVGGRAEAYALNERDIEICKTIGPTLREQGLIFAGIDVIGGVLTEINVTSPTGLQEIGRFDGVSLEAQIWDAIETRLAGQGD